MEDKKRETLIIKNEKSNVKLGMIIIILVAGIFLYLNGYRIGIKEKVEDSPKYITLESVEETINEHQNIQERKITERRMERLVDECVYTEVTKDFNGNNVERIVVTGKLLELIEEENKLAREKNGNVKNLEKNKDNKQSKIITIDDVKTPSINTFEVDGYIVPSNDLMKLIEEENRIAREKLEK